MLTFIPPSPPAYAEVEAQLNRVNLMFEEISGIRYFFLTIVLFTLNSDNNIASVNFKANHTEIQGHPYNTSYFRFKCLETTVLFSWLID